jgi:hypothetical protein
VQPFEQGGVGLEEAGLRTRPLGLPHEGEHRGRKLVGGRLVRKERVLPLTQQHVSELVEEGEEQRGARPLPVSEPQIQRFGELVAQHDSLVAGACPVAAAHLDREGLEDEDRRELLA